MNSEMINYWKVWYNPDLTETGMCQKVAYLQTTWSGIETLKACEKEFVEDFCYSRFGGKIKFVQGVAATCNWDVFKSDKQEFEKANPMVLWGGYPIGIKRIKMNIGNPDTGTIITEEETVIV